MPGHTAKEAPGPGTWPVAADMRQAAQVCGLQQQGHELGDALPGIVPGPAEWTQGRAKGWWERRSCVKAVAGGLQGLLVGHAASQKHSLRGCA